MTRTVSARRIRKGFTFVEILIVVIILGILAAIVIPQFTSASEDARRNSCASLLQTIRAQLELYKLQHSDRWPTTSGGAVASEYSWSAMTGTTTWGGKTYGPYLQQIPVNPFNNRSGVYGTVAAAAAAADGGFVFDTNGKFYAIDANGAAFGGP